jgi:hypothetical protein
MANQHLVLLLNQCQDICIKIKKDIPIFIEAVKEYALHHMHDEKVKALIFIEKNDGMKLFYPLRDILQYSYETIISRAFNLPMGTISNQEYNFEQEIQNKDQSPFYNIEQFNGLKSIGIHFFINQRNSLTKINKRDYVFKSGAFFPMINKSPLQLLDYQIYDYIPKIDTFCFIHALLLSKLLKENQKDILYQLIEVRSFPKKKIREISNKFNIQIEIIEYPHNNWKSKVLNPLGCVKMLLIQNHYILQESYDNLGKCLVDLRLSIHKKPTNKDKNEEKEKDPYELTNFFKLLSRINAFKQIDPTDLNFLNSVENTTKLSDYTTLDYDEENCCRKYRAYSSKKTFSYMICSDFESDTSTNPHTPYLCCSAWYAREPSDSEPNPDNQFRSPNVSTPFGRMKYKVHQGNNCGKKYLQWLPNNCLVFFHNLKYDSTFFLNEKGVKNVKFIQRSGTILQIDLDYFQRIDGVLNNKHITFKDSYSFIPRPLRDFGIMFQLSVEKDVCPYKIYTQKNRDQKWVKLKEVLDVFQNDDDKIQFINNCIKLHIIHHYNDISFHPINQNIDTMDTSQRSIPINHIDTMDTSHRYDTINPIHPIRSMHTSQRSIPINPIDTIHESIPSIPIIQPLDTIHEWKPSILSNPMYYIVNIIDYSIYYCKKDVDVLLQGLTRFNNDLKQVFQDNNVKFEGIENYVSISSIGYSLAGKFGCFHGCYELAGKPQNFIMRSVLGGRVMLNKNKKIVIDDAIQDFDAVSLYPSAMSKMKLLKGKPKIIPNDKPFNPFDYDGYFIEINIKKIDDIYGFPLIFKRDKKKSKIFVNEPINHYYVDKTTLLDLIEFYPNFQFEFLRGYYYNDGFNCVINKFITDLFELRRKYKILKNPLETTIKLLLNSIYGKSILKATPCKIIAINKNNLDRYVIQHQNEIVEINTNDDIETAYIKIKDSVADHFNLCSFGCMVLSQSKHLMNRVMCLAENNGIEIFYVDTDSMHIRDKDIIKLSKLFKDKYGEELIGSNLCQYHSDFAPINGKPSWSIKFIGLGKKAYLDVLTNEDGDKDYHIRMKGCAIQSIYSKCEEEKITVEDLYMKLYEGESITFNMLSGNPGFKRSKSYQYSTLEEFNRTVHFE